MSWLSAKEPRSGKTLRNLLTVPYFEACERCRLALLTRVARDTVGNEASQTEPDKIPVR